ncbi:MAG: GyrI-like domain-containing protein [Bacteroidia bacterium]
MTSLLKDKTAELWKGFMAERNTIANKISDDLYSVQVFDKKDLKGFNGNTKFEKWAAVEVSSFDDVPAGMETFVVPGGEYAVFTHAGHQQDFDYIYKNWLPASKYILDDRPHFAVMGERYKSDDPGSEEEIWIPVRLVTAFTDDTTNTTY